MGPSGCGKSTLLNLIGALDRPTRGEIEVDGVRVDRLSEAAAAPFRRATVGFVFQFFHLLDDLTVADNIGVPALLAGRSRSEAERGPTSCSPSSASPTARQLPDDAQRRRTSARRDRARHRQPACRPARRRADRRPRPTQRRDRAGLLEDLNRRGQTIVLVTHDEHLAAAARPSDRPSRRRRIVATSPPGWSRDGRRRGRRPSPTSVVDGCRRSSSRRSCASRPAAATLALEHPRRVEGAVRHRFREGERRSSRDRLRRGDERRRARRTARRRP